MFCNGKGFSDVTSLRYAFFQECQASLFLGGTGVEQKLPNNRLFVLFQRRPRPRLSSVFEADLDAILFVVVFAGGPETALNGVHLFFLLQPCIARPHRCFALALRVTAPARLLRCSRPDHGKCFVATLHARLTMVSTPAQLLRYNTARTPDQGKHTRPTASL